MTTLTNIPSVPGLALILALCMGPATASAQHSSTTDRISAWTAEMLENEARSRAGSAGTYLEAGELYRRAAQVRGDGDRRAIADLRAAGRMAYYAGRSEQAWKDFRRAGDLAREQGLPNETLEAYYDAAWVAQRARQYEAARRIVRRISLLTLDPHFLAALEPEILARVVKLRAGTG